MANFSTIMKDKNDSLILALDIGTSSTRALVYDTTGQSLNIGSRCEYQMDLTADGGVEIDAEQLLLKICHNIDEVMTTLGKKAGAICAVAVSTFWHSLVGVDQQGRPTTPVISWNDTRSATYAHQFRNQFDERASHLRTGCRWHASYWPAKLKWLAAQLPTAFAATRQWLSFGDYLWLQLFGEATTSISLASGTGLFNQQDCRWDQLTLDLLALDDTKLPRISGEPGRQLRAEFANRWPTLQSIPWFLPIGDGAANNIGSGCVEANRFALMIGTSGALRAVSTGTTFTIPAELWCYRVDDRRIVMGGALSNGGDLFAWLREMFQLPPLAELEQELTALPPDGHGLTFLPLLSGERSPGWHDQASATISGLRLATRPVEIMRAGMEAVAIQFAILYQALSGQMGNPTEVVATGGALYYSRIWRQIIADCLARPVRVASVAEASSRGVTLLALEALQIIPPLSSASFSEDQFDEIHQPEPANRSSYQKAQQRYAVLYQRLIAEDWLKLV